jgi:hypothetical protein
MRHERQPRRTVLQHNPPLCNLLLLPPSPKIAPRSDGQSVQLGRPGRYLTVLEVFRVTSASLCFLALPSDGRIHLQ